MGKNTDFVHKGAHYHVQTEEWLSEEGLIMTQVFSSGKVVFTKKYHCGREGLCSDKMKKAHKEALEDFKSLLI